MIWTPKSDILSFKLDSQITSDSRMKSEVDEYYYQLTPRDVLSLLARKGKILMRRTFTENNDMRDERKKWNSPISITLHQEWMKFFDKSNKVEKVKFKRCLRPDE